MQSKTNCPKCNSSDIDFVKYLENYYLICDSCGYDESAKFDADVQQKTSQKAKAEYSPYKSRVKN